MSQSSCQNRVWSDNFVLKDPSALIVTLSLLPSWLFWFTGIIRWDRFFCRHPIISLPLKTPSITFDFTMFIGMKPSRHRCLLFTDFFAEHLRHEMFCVMERAFSCIYELWESSKGGFDFGLRFIYTSYTSFLLLNIWYLYLCFFVCYLV